MYCTAPRLETLELVQYKADQVVSGHIANEYIARTKSEKHLPTNDKKLSQLIQK